jgi:diguanylate cyclase (GGDEF)-like protein
MNGRKVLIVDDDRATVFVVRSALAPLGCRFYEASDGSQALSALRQHRPDLILMDVEMPGLGGVEVCRIIKANQSETAFGFIPVILMTARQRADKIEGLELGADDFLIKPIDLLELSARVKSMLRLKILQDALRENNRELHRANKELDQKRRALVSLVRTDVLTGLYNRRYFEERMAVEFARSQRYRVPLSCLMLDVDHFKRVNDTYGHPFGDRVLMEIAKVTKQTLRDVDLIARYGGEELIALLPETGPRQASRVSERIREGIAALRLAYASPSGAENTVGCTASIGVATFPAPGVASAEDLLRAADDCLYLAKGAGKNQVCQHGA